MSERIAENRFDRLAFIGRGIKRLGVGVGIVGGVSGAAFVGKSLLDLNAHYKPSPDEIKEDSKEMSRGGEVLAGGTLVGLGIYRVGELIEDHAEDRQKKATSILPGQRELW